MKLRCQLKGVKCPRYKHSGIFQPDDETIKSLLLDVNWCAGCIARTPPQCLDIREDLQQTAAIVLITKGPQFNPTHPSGANFGTFIRPRICGALMNVKCRELTHKIRESSNSDKDFRRLWKFTDPYAEFEDELVRDLSFQDALPKLLKTLTPREREVFACIREDQQNCEIAEVLNLSESRVSQLVTQVMQKLRNAGQKLGLSE